MMNLQDYGLMQIRVNYPPREKKTNVAFNMQLADPSEVARRAARLMGLDPQGRYDLAQEGENITEWGEADFDLPFELWTVGTSV